MPDKEREDIKLGTTADPAKPNTNPFPTPEAEILAGVIRAISDDLKTQTSVNPPDVPFAPGTILDSLNPPNPKRPH